MGISAKKYPMKWLFYFKDNDLWASYAHSLMQFGLLFYVAFFPIGISAREIGSIWSLIGLVAFYIFGWRKSLLRKLNFKWLYFGFIAFILFKTVHSEFPLMSWEAIKHNLYKGFPLLVVGLEFVRRSKDLRLLVWAFVIAGTLLGLDGLYQSIFGVDLIAGTPLLGGRLTGSLSTPRAGNYMSMVIPITVAMLLTLPQKWKLVLRVVLVLLVLALEVYFVAGTGTRSALLGVVVAITVLGLVSKKTRISTCVAVLLVGLAVFMVPERFVIERLMNDLRLVEIWPQAVELFKLYPVMGAGVNTFGNAYELTGIAAGPKTLGWPHPHNIYLQFLCETGVVGLVVLCVFLFGTIGWVWKVLKDSGSCKIDTSWMISYCLFASTCGYAATALFAHNFYRTWWLGIAFTVLGLTIGSSQFVSIRNSTGKQFRVGIGQCDE